MPEEITLRVNGRERHVHVEPDTALLYVLRNDLGLKGAKVSAFGIDPLFPAVVRIHVHPAEIRSAETRPDGIDDQVLVPDHDGQVEQVGFRVVPGAKPPG